MEKTELLALVLKLLGTIKAYGGYPIPEVLPEVHLVPQTELVASACFQPCRVQGYYVKGEGVYVDRELDLLNDRKHRSVLLHELVHYVQDVHGRFDDYEECRRYQAQEREAYGIQNRYLRRYNESPYIPSRAVSWLRSGCGSQALNPRN